MLKTAKFCLTRSTAHRGRWNWRLRGANGRIVASGQAIGLTKRAAVHAIYHLSIWAREAANRGGFEEIPVPRAGEERR